MMGRLIRGWNGFGVCDRLTAMLLTCRIARATSRIAVWEWVINRNCSCPFSELFETGALHVAHGSVKLQGKVLAEGGKQRGHAIFADALEAADEPVLVIEQGYFGHNYDDLSEFIQPSAAVRGSVERFMEAHWADRMIGVHIRTTDRSSCGLPTVVQYCAAIDEMVEAGAEKIFLSTDHPSSIVPFSARYGKRLCGYPVRTWQRSCAEGIVDAVISLYLLRSCHGVIGSSVSGFSLCAAWECGFVDLRAKRVPNSDWAGQKLLLKPPALLNRRM